MSQSGGTTEIFGRMEQFFRRFFARLGAAFDFTLGRRAPFDPAALIPSIEREIESRLRESEGRLLAPSRIELRYDYETFSRFEPAQVELIRRELEASIYEYIHNRRYTLAGDLSVRLRDDIFTRRVVIKALFPDEVREQGERGAGRLAAGEGAIEIVLRPAVRGPELKARLAGDQQLSLGRSRDNALIINDATVSNVHASFSSSNQGEVCLADLGSSNGSYVNGERLGDGDKRALRSGDRLRFGDVDFALEIKSPSGHPQR
jgi:pSer/pThr/pTyr-binding forkhead associated (FHA) protein